jgi:RNA polymerase sigma-70 factor, ECF subfamily
MELAAGRSAVRDDPGGSDIAVRFVAGDAAAFERVVELNADRLSALVYRLLGYRGDVDDVVQDVFLAALEGRRKFRVESSLWTWLTAIAVNRCRSVWRRRRLKSLLVHERAGPAADEPAIADETTRQVRRAVAGLPMRLREVVVLHYLQEMPVDEIGVVLGISRPAIEVRLHRAREKLRRALPRMVIEEC